MNDGDHKQCCGSRDPLEQIRSLYTELALQPDRGNKSKAAVKFHIRVF
jgi:hypothetical protein